MRIRATRHGRTLHAYVWYALPNMQPQHEQSGLPCSMALSALAVHRTRVSSWSYSILHVQYFDCSPVPEDLGHLGCNTIVAQPCPFIGAHVVASFLAANILGACSAPHLHETSSQTMCSTSSPVGCHLILRTASTCIVRYFHICPSRQYVPAFNPFRLPKLNANP